jgi:hypothetical protein
MPRLCRKLYRLCRCRSSRERRTCVGSLHSPLPRLRGRMRRRHAHPRPPDRSQSPNAAQYAGGVPGSVPCVRRRVRAPRGSPRALPPLCGGVPAVRASVRATALCASHALGSSDVCGRVPGRQPAAAVSPPPLEAGGLGVVVRPCSTVLIRRPGAHTGSSWDMSGTPVGRTRRDRDERSPLAATFAMPPQGNEP